MSERRNTKQFAAIREVLAQEQRPLSIGEIHTAARGVVPTLGLRTVYRVVHRMEDDGDLARVSISGQPDRYEHAEAAARHHHHFHCLMCDRVFDVHGCPGRMDQMVPEGFVLAGHEITLYGRCGRCSEG